MNLLTKYLAGLLLIAPLQALMFWPVSIALAALVHPAFALFAVLPWIVALFARRDKYLSTDYRGAGPLVNRGDLPRALSWFETHDERLPGGFYEKQVSDLYQVISHAQGKLPNVWWDHAPFEWTLAIDVVLERIAFWFTSGYWMSRNKLYRAAAKLGVVIPTDAPVDYTIKGTHQGRLGWDAPGWQLFTIRSTEGKLYAWELQVQYPFPWSKTRESGTRWGFYFRTGWKIEPLRSKLEWNDPRSADQMFTFSPRPFRPIERGYSMVYA